MAQEYILDNLPAGESSAEVFFTGQWCNGPGKAGKQPLESCAPNNTVSTYTYAPNLPAGIYDLYIRWAKVKNLSNNVPVRIDFQVRSAGPVGSGARLRLTQRGGPCGRLACRATAVVRAALT